MTKINLLPWREIHRTKKQNEFFVLLSIGIAIACGLVIFSQQFVQSKIDNQVARNNFLEREIQALQLELKEISKLESTKDSLLSRMEIVQTLQTKRPQIVHVFHELAELLPNGVFLTSMKQNEEKIILEGKAESNARVSSLMRQLDGSDWFTSPDLEVINADRSTGISTFKLSLMQSKPKLIANDEQASIGVQHGS